MKQLSALILTILLSCLCIAELYATDSRVFSPFYCPTNGEKPIELYSGSYALLIGMSNYKAGWPSLPGVGSDIGRVEERH